jgi:hypothetical protein
MPSGDFPPLDVPLTKIICPSTINTYNYYLVVALPIFVKKLSIGFP